MSVSTFGKVVGGAMVAIGGWNGYRAITCHDEAGAQEQAGNHTTSGALDRKAITDGLFAASAVTSGVLSLLNKGSSGLHSVLTGTMLASMGAGLLAASSLKDARAADAEITKLRSEVDAGATTTPKRPPHQLPRQYPTQLPPRSFDDLPVLIPGRQAGTAVSAD